jgi:hypothetical protein
MHIQKSTTPGCGEDYRRRILVNGLTSGFVTFFDGALAEELEVLVSLHFEVIGELFWGEAAGEGCFEGVAFLAQQFDGAEVVFFERACPGLVCVPDRFLQWFPFEYARGEFDGPVGGGREATLCGGDEPDGGVEAHGVAQEARYAAGLFGRDL